MKTKRKNRVLCKLCLDIIESKFRHDYVTCFCEAVSVDGGNDFFKRSGNPENILELAFPEKLIYVTPCQQCDEKINAEKAEFWAKKSDGLELENQQLKEKLEMAVKTKAND